ncbi:Replication factor C subunit 2 [Verticillium dahliae VDG1]|nr:Replication factor C subunit 2 [Verticillium dahliae VDG1]
MSESFEIVDAFMRYPQEPYLYRILTESSVFKYLVSPSAPPGACFPDIRGEFLAFTSVSRGDWTIGRLGPTGDGRLSLSSTENTRLTDVCTPWHASRIDLLDLPSRLSGVDTLDELQCHGQLTARVVTTPSRYGQCPTAICFWIWQPHFRYGLYADSKMYAAIEGHGIAPKFLAHITENRSRVIGHMLERLKVRLATIHDMGKCQAVLARLHGLGITHGGLSRHSFLIDDERRCAYLHGFVNSYHTTDNGVLQAELNSLGRILPRKPDPLTVGQEKL